jgi:hypothetical protein
MASADLDTVWMRTYGGPANDGLRQAIPAADGCVVAVGYTYSYSPGEVDVYAVKVDAGGDTVWTRALGGAGRDYGYGVCETSDGGYALVGYTTSAGAGGEDVYVIKLDAGGSVIWARTYGGAGSDEGRAICQSGDGGFVIAGRTASYGSGESDVYLLKLDADGDTVWTRVYGGAEYDWSEGVSETADGCYCVCGTTGSNSLSRDIYLVKVDEAGGLVWQRYYGDFVTAFSHDWGTGLCATADSGVAVTGNRIIAATDPSDAYFLRTDGLGTQTSLKRYADSFVEYGRSICETPDGGFLVCGAEKTEDTLKNDLMLAKRIGGSGWLWRQLVGGAGSDCGNSVVEMSTGYYLVAGQTDSYGAGGYDGWLIKLKEPQAAVGGNGAPTVAFLDAPAPNPAGLTTTLRFGLAYGAETEVSIYDVSGRRVRLLAAGWREGGEHTARWDGKDDAGRDVCPGIYLVRVSSGSFRAASKLVVLRK